MKGTGSMSGQRALRVLKAIRAVRGHIVQHRLRALAVALVLLALVALWWFGPAWKWHGDRPLAAIFPRLVVTAIVLCFALVVWALLKLNDVARSQKGQEAGNGEGRAAQDIVGMHVKQFTDALDENLALIRENLHGRNWRYRTPWYLVIGREHSGKTSFINRSNQHFALSGVARAAAIQTPLMTNPRNRNDGEARPYKVEWWIGHDAVLIDPDGELLTKPNVHEGEGEYAGKLWTAFVGWLARSRARRPLNGVILMLDLPTLLTQRASERKAMANIQRARLHELMAQLGTRLPVYVVLSKLDLLQGFDAIFGQLPAAQREREMGFTFSLAAVNEPNAWMPEFDERYAAFLESMNAWAFDALAEQTPGQDLRHDAYALVRELAGVRDIVREYLRDVLSTDRYTSAALVRGVYFSSVWQQGEPANALLAGASRAYSMPHALPGARPAGRSIPYFVSNLFQRIIYPEAGLAGDNMRVAMRKRVLMRVSTVCAFVLCVGMVGGWHHYYLRNRTAVGTVLEEARAFTRSRVDTRVDATGENLLEPLNRIGRAVQVYANYRSAWPAFKDMGLYQGKVVGPEVDAAYLGVLSSRFLPELAAGAAVRIAQAPAGSNAQLGALRVYRMIESLRNRRPVIVEDWMGRTWQAAFPGDGTRQGQLMQHLDYAMRYADARLPDNAAPTITQAQADLRRLPMSERVYRMMKGDASAELPVPLDLRAEVGTAFDLVYAAAHTEQGTGNTAQAQGMVKVVNTVNSPMASPWSIDSITTRKGFTQYFAPQVQDVAGLALIDQWVLGITASLDYSDEDRKALALQIREAYTSDYISAWRRHLDALQVVDFRNLDDAVAVLGTVSGPAAPLRRLLEVVRDNSVIYPSSPGKPDMAALPANAGESRPAPADLEQARRIEREFAPLDALLVAHGDKPAYIDALTQAVANLYDYMRAIRDSADPGNAALQAVRDGLSQKGATPVSALQIMSGGLPAPLNSQARALADQSWRVLQRAALDRLEQKWQSDVYAFYHARLESRYPLNPASANDASLDDFAKFFGPGGLLETFDDQYLKLFMNEDAGGPARNAPLVRADLAGQLRAAANIEDAFFDNRGAMSLQFSVEPLGLSADQYRSVLDVDGQVLTFAHGPAQPSGLLWPNTLQDGVESKLTLVGGTGASRALRYQGPWGWFRLLSQGELNGATLQSVDLSFAVGSGVMRYRVSTGKPNNPFTHRLFDGFMLPRTLSGTAANAAKPALPGTVATESINIGKSRG